MPGLSWFPRWLNGKESARQCRRCRFDSLVWKVPWRRALQSTPVFLPGKVQGQRSLVGYSSWGHKESDTTERLSTLIRKPFQWSTGLLHLNFTRNLSQAGKGFPKQGSLCVRCRSVVLPTASRECKSCFTAF